MRIHVLIFFFFLLIHLHLFLLIFSRFHNSTDIIYLFLLLLHKFSSYVDVPCFHNSLYCFTFSYILCVYYGTRHGTNCILTKRKNLVLYMRKVSATCIVNMLLLICHVFGLREIKVFVCLSVCLSVCLIPVR